jgi:hypothetical protein
VENMADAHIAVALLNSARSLDDKPSGFQGKYFIIDEPIDYVSVERRVLAHMQMAGFSVDQVYGSLAIDLHLLKDQTHA